MAVVRITPHQKETLLGLARKAMLMATERPGRWIHAKDSGGPSALEHLYRKGYAERDIRIGERGGEHLYYRPTTEGYAVVDREFDKRRVERGEMTMGEIDTRLIEARRTGAIVRIFVGPAKAEFRGVPGEVARDEDGVLRMQFGQRRVALNGITSVQS